MPWLAQYADLPDTHKHHADPGSELEAVFVRLGYVEVPAPGADQHDVPVDADSLVVEGAEDDPEDVSLPDEEE